MECQICFNPFDIDESTPKVLKCGHSYCLRCITSMTSSTQSFMGARTSVTCALCRATSDAGEINTNYALLEVLRTRTEDPQPSAPPLNEMKRCVTHNEEVDAFCDSCSIFICRLCYQASSADHSAHIRLSLQDATQRIVGLAQNRLHDAREQKNQAHEKLQNIDQSVRQLQERIAILDSQAHAFFSRCQEQLQAQHERFSLDLLKHYETIGQDYAQKAQGLRVLHDQWHNVELRLQGVCDKGGSLDAIQTLVESVGDQLPERVDKRTRDEREQDRPEIDFYPLVGNLPNLYELRRMDAEALPSEFMRLSVSAVPHSN